jgi:hypothetical protein
MAIELEADANGVITFLPILEWSVTVVQGKTIGLAVDYYASAADAAAMKPSRVQLHLDPGPAQQLGRALAQQGERVLASSGKP